MVISAKIPKRKYLGAVVVVLVCAMSLALFIVGCTKDEKPDLSSNEERVAYLNSLGYTVTIEPVKTQTVNVPEQMNDTLQKYNDIQLQQGMDLSAYLGQSVTRYVYRIENYQNAPGDVYATLFIKDNSLIAADLTCWEEDGFCLPLLKPQA